MTSLPTTTELLAVADYAYDHRFADVELDVELIVSLARHAEPDFDAINVLADRSRPDIVRSRAFARLAGAWEGIRRQLESEMHFDAAYDELVAAWLDHQDLHDQRAPVAELEASRRRLDAARLDVAHRRAAI